LLGHHSRLLPKIDEECSHP